LTERIVRPIAVEKIGVTRDQCEAAVKKVGVMAKDVERELKAA
jgi:hypothetical protein